MAPISEKLQRPEQSPLKESRVGTHIFGQLHAHNASSMQQQLRQVHHRNYFNTKENTNIGGSSNNNNNKTYAFKIGGGGGGSGGNSPTKHMKRGLEILDFRESWLEEMELYKDQLNQHRHYTNQPTLVAITTATTPTTASQALSHAHVHAHHLSKNNVVGNTVSLITPVQPNQQHLQQLHQIYQYSTHNNCQHESHNCSTTLANKSYNNNHIHYHNNSNRNSLGMGVIDHYNEEIPFEKSATPITPITTTTGRISPKRHQKKRNGEQQYSNKIIKNAIRGVPIIAAPSPNLTELDVPTPVLDLLKTAEKQVSSILKHLQLCTQLCAKVRHVKQQQHHFKCYA